MKKCPYCAEEVKDEAIKCKHCGEILDKSSRPVAEEGLMKKEEFVVMPISIITLILPGFAQLFKGERLKALVLFFLTGWGAAEGGSGLTSFVPLLIFGLISFADSRTLMYKCPQCNHIVKFNDNVCSRCHSKFYVTEKKRNECASIENQRKLHANIGFIIILALLLIIFLSQHK